MQTKKQDYFVPRHVFLVGDVLIGKEIWYVIVLIYILKGYSKNFGKVFSINTMYFHTHLYRG